MKFSLNLKKSMIGFCLLIGIVPFLVIGVYSYQVASDNLSRKAFDQLTAVRDIKDHGIEDRIEVWFSNLDMLASDEYVLEAFEAISEYLASGGTKGDQVDLESTWYNSLHDNYFKHFERYVETLGFYDAFIMDPEGRVLFTVTRESDLGQNLASGWLRNSSLAKAWKQALRSGSGQVFVDFEPYAPSNGIPAAFIAQPVYHKGELVCVAALQISLTRLNNFMQSRAGMGRTGEAYLVGQDNLMRSDSALYPEQTVAASFANPEKNRVESDAVRKALEGETGAEIITDFEGNQVLAAYSPVSIGDTTWALIANVDRDEAFAAVDQLRRDMIIVGAVIFVVIILAAIVFINRELLRPFTALQTFAHKVAEGDLDATPEGRFKPELADLRDSIFSMVGNLKAKMGEAEQKSVEASQQADKAQSALTEAEAQQQKVRNLLETMKEIADQANVIAERVSSSTDQLAAQVEQVSRGAEMQRDRVGETATAMEQMNSTVMEVASNASNASANSDRAKEKAASGAAVVNEVVQAINRVNQLAERLKDNTQTLGSEAESINQVMNVISDIADQTNLLALNAAIEAARAGEAGRGFAVVADEVRKLAEKTMSATKEVGDNIGRVQDAARMNMESVDQAVGAVSDATEKANESGAALREIVGLVEESATQVTGIATAAEEQSAASEQINQSVEEINRIVAETAEGMVQSAQAVQELSTMADELRNLIRQLNVEDQNLS
ncbi:chemotaxis protein [Oceanidesulfovibrio indonesiensis]|uniref:Chemotaxis protein n=1 Tax=Oceanidesulfovibrio indonesiensis TaxID=54767 RepID=A0A7M3MI93_9BACT|nr:methyl-accepting chemotaxis protein [Oceanidesulfovibrio indonesiensis]TVM19403.1 chemotaxis protein [Oceanidesulfovibrio indonesiensis]